MQLIYIVVSWFAAIELLMEQIIDGFWKLAKINDNPIVQWFWTSIVGDWGWLGSCLLAMVSRAHCRWGTENHLQVHGFTQYLYTEKHFEVNLSHIVEQISLNCMYFYSNIRLDPATVFPLGIDFQPSRDSNPSNARCDQQFLDCNTPKRLVIWYYVFAIFSLKILFATRAAVWYRMCGIGCVVSDVQTQAEGGVHIFVHLIQYGSRGVTKAMLGKGSEYSYIRVLPDKFLLK